MNLGDRNHQIVQRVMIAADDGLQRLRNATGGHHRIAGFVGHGAMTAHALNVNVKRINRGHDRPRRGVKSAFGQVWSIVQRIDLRDVEPVHDTFLNHNVRAAALFLGRLKDQRHAAREVSRLGQITGCTQQHRGMPVMTAGMHLTGMFRGIVHARFFRDRQRIHVGAQSDRRPLGLPIDDCDDTGCSDALMYFIYTKLAQPVGDKSCCLVALKLQFGDRMQVLPPRGHIGGKIGNSVDDGHLGWTPVAVCGMDASDTGTKGFAMAENPLIHDSDAGIERLLEIMRRLRDPQTGCPWDIEQDFATIAPYTIEEAYEVADAIEREAYDELKGELGDLLFQSVFHAQMAEEAGHFTFQDVVRTMSDKMVARHPHVFGDESRDKSAEQQTLDWETIKAAERAGKEQKGALDGVAANLPALLRAHKLQKRAARVGFDWPDASHVLAKITEEAAELEEARDSMDADALEDEFGDLLFVIVNLGRHLGIEPEAALRRTNAKFTRRFEQVEARLAARGKTPGQSDLAEMDALWDEVKTEEHRANGKLPPVDVPSGA